MRIEIDSTQFSKLKRDTYEWPRETMARVRSTVKAVSFAVEKRIKIAMPVDKGRARASWGHWTPSDLRAANADSSPADSIWRETDGGLTIEQGSNVPYIEGLNSGHSRQAPAGFLDDAQLQGQVTLETELGLLDPTAPGAEIFAFLGIRP